MSSVPVTATISRAYGFLLGEIGTIVRLTWAPLLLGAGLSYLYGAPSVDGSGAVTAGPALFIISIVSFVTGMMAMAALLRVVVFGDRLPGLYVYLWPGAAELRLIVVTLLLGIALVAAALGGGIVFALVATLAAAIPVLSVVLLAAIVGVIGLAIWVPLRLSLTYAVAVAENSLGVERSWALTRGNALRMFAVLLATYGACTVVTWIALVTILGADYPAPPAFPDLGGADAMKSEAAMKAVSEAFQKSLEQWQIAFAKAIAAHWPEISVLTFVSNMVSTALWAGATGSAYLSAAGPRHG